MLLFIVARDERRLYATLRQEFAGERGIEVVLDRRVAERRRQAVAHGQERRRRDRRRQAAIDADLRALGWAIVKRRDPAA